MHRRVGALRLARSSHRYDAAIAFYRDVLGLPVVGEFAGSFGEDGTIFGLPDASTQLEIVRAHHGGGADDAPDQLVFYLADPESVSEATAALRAHGYAPAAPPPYWQANGAVEFRDPDDRSVVFAPWVYGRGPHPADGATSGDDTLGQGEWTVEVDWYDGDREAIRPLFELAEDSVRQLESYLGQGRVLLARRGSVPVGHLQLTSTGRPEELEVKNMAVVPELRGTGIGHALVEAAVEASVADDVVRLVVATGAADTGNLRFYQRCGFRFASVERDAFTPATGYPDQIIVEGVPLLDRVWLTRDLGPV